MILVALAGLPGTGKSTLARRLAADLRAPVLDKDRLRAGLFPPERIQYSREQDDRVVRVLYALAEHHARRGRVSAVILDGRTYSKRQHVEELRALAQRLHVPLSLVECTCAEEVARERLERDAATRAHPAANRGFGLYLELRAAAEAIDPPKLVVRTDEGSPDEQVERILAYVRS